MSFNFPNPLIWGGSSSPIGEVTCESAWAFESPVARQFGTELGAPKPAQSYPRTGRMTDIAGLPPHAVCCTMRLPAEKPPYVP
jgi:hypothetical protein